MRQRSSADFPSAVSPNCIRQTVRPGGAGWNLERAADYKSAIRQSATLRYAGGPLAPLQCRDFRARPFCEARPSDSAPAFASSRNALAAMRQRSSADFPSAVSPNCIRQTVRPGGAGWNLERAADYKSAIRQSATLRYAGGPLAPLQCRDFRARPFCEARPSDSAPAFASSRNALAAMRQRSSADFPSAVSPNCIRQTVRPGGAGWNLERAADYKSAIRQSATLRYAGGPLAPLQCRDFRARPFCEARPSDSAPAFASSRNALAAMRQRSSADFPSAVSPNGIRRTVRPGGAGWNLERAADYKSAIRQSATLRYAGGPLAPLQCRDFRARPFCEARPSDSAPAFASSRNALAAMRQRSSADFPSAVSPNCIRQTVRPGGAGWNLERAADYKSAIRQSATLRYAGGPLAPLQCRDFRARPFCEARPSDSAPAFASSRNALAAMRQRSSADFPSAVSPNGIRRTVRPGGAGWNLERAADYKSAIRQSATLRYAGGPLAPLQCRDFRARPFCEARPSDSAPAFASSRNALAAMRQRSSADFPSAVSPNCIRQTVRPGGAGWNLERAADYKSAIRQSATLRYAGGPLAPLQCRDFRARPFCEARPSDSAPAFASSRNALAAMRQRSSADFPSAVSPNGIRRTVRPGGAGWNLERAADYKSAIRQSATLRYAGGPLAPLQCRDFRARPFCEARPSDSAPAFASSRNALAAMRQRSSADFPSAVSPNGIRRTVRPGGAGWNLERAADYKSAIRQSATLRYAGGPLAPLQCRDFRARPFCEARPSDSAPAFASSRNALAAMRQRSSADFPSAVSPNGIRRTVRPGGAGWNLERAADYKSAIRQSATLRYAGGPLAPLQCRDFRARPFCEARPSDSAPAFASSRNALAAMRQRSSADFPSAVSPNGIRRTVRPGGAGWNLERAADYKSAIRQSATLRYAGGPLAPLQCRDFRARPFCEARPSDSAPAFASSRNALAAMRQRSSADFPSAVSPNGIRRTVRPGGAGWNLERAADYKSAIRQSATLRYAGGPLAPLQCRDFRARPFCE